jgi:hypothetical protein
MTRQRKLLDSRFKIDFRLVIFDGNTDEYVPPDVCMMSYIANIMKQDDSKKYRKAITAVLEADDEDEDTFLFVENTLQAIYNFHTTYKDIHDGETQFNVFFLFPFLKAVVAAVAAEFGAAETDFCHREVCLEAMST